MDNKLFCRHEIRQFQKKLNINTFEPSDIEFEVGPNLIRCRTVKKDGDFLIEPDQEVGDQAKWLIA